MLKLSNLESIGKPVYKFQNKHSVDFDGVDDRIDLGEAISYTQHTISTWLKMPNSTPTKIIFDARDTANDGIRIRALGTEKIKYDLNNSSLESTNAFQDEWVHVVATYDGTTQKLYINGALDQSATTSQTISTTTNARIGARSYTSATNFYEGKIDELAIYDRALEEEEVTKIYRIKYGANLVQNGNFDELGSELVTQPLNLSSNFQNNGGGIIVDNDTFTTAGGSFDGITSPSSFLVTGKTYKLIIAGNTTSSGFTIGNQVLSGNEYATGFGTHYFVASGDRLWIRQQTEGTTNITSFSIKQVDPNDRFTLGTGWEINDRGLVLTSTQTTNAFQAVGLVQNNFYKITFTVANVTSGGARIRLGTGALSSPFTNGTHTLILEHTTSNDAVRIYANSSGVFDGSVTNIMVEEQKYVATNLKLNSLPYSSSNLRNYYRMGDGILDKFPLICDMVEPSLGSELVTNGDYSNGLTGWSADSEWSEENGLAVFDGSGVGSLQQSGVTTVGKTFKLTFDVTEITNRSGLRVINVTFNDTYALGNEINVGTNTFNFTPVNGTGIRFRASSGTTCKIDNVSVKQVNGVPGMMTNMTEADITNDVPG